MTITNWKLANAQTVGRGHLKQQIPCQDFTLSVQTEDMTILVLADGAGSASSSHIGAKAVVQKMANILQNHFEDMFYEEDNQLLRKRIIGILINEIENINEFSGNVKDFASTLLYVAIKDDRYLAGHIGDGAIGIQVKEGNFKVLSNPENGLYANTTYFITSDEAWKYLRLYKGSTEGKNGFILMSDGTAESLFNKKAQGFAPAITRMLDWLRNHPNQKIAEVLENNLETVIKQQTQDDCSIALASLVTWNAEELSNMSPEYQADFFGVHCKLPITAEETVNESFEKESELTNHSQGLEDECEDIDDADYDHGEEPDEMDPSEDCTDSEEYEAEIESENLSDEDENEEESVSITEYLTDSNSLDDDEDFEKDAQEKELEKAASYKENEK